MNRPRCVVRLIAAKLGDPNSVTVVVNGHQIEMVTSYRIAHEAGDIMRLQLTLLPDDVEILTDAYVWLRADRWYHRLRRVVRDRLRLANLRMRLRVRRAWSRVKRQSQKPALWRK